MNHLRPHFAPRPRMTLLLFLRFVGLLLALLAADPLLAQFVPGQGFGGFGGGGNNASRSRSSRTYPNNQVGDAVISIDPETRSLIVIADEDTSRYISQVVSNLDRPKPQVLIKVVFLEVTHNDSLDLGVEGSYGKNLGNSFTSGAATNFTVRNISIVPQNTTPAAARLSCRGIDFFIVARLVPGSSAGL